ncbi:hypothetical protein JJV70_04815 [Streptomyces sp. JJ66]|uniref:hypothetical protein n=1 Tax=Streptomyces sp. JJ66 TaxID=2803843 RepID=UPI001C59AAD1|nr:hypothetical protein [Streptomyces sp. JJ66]MBW1601438.1 hypothetical protein [Streptomyces sp. JJ66]
MSMKTKFQILILATYVASIVMLVTGVRAEGVNKVVALTLGVVGVFASVTLTFITWRGFKNGKKI